VRVAGRRFAVLRVTDAGLVAGTVPIFVVIVQYIVGVRQMVVVDVELMRVMVSKLKSVKGSRA